MQPALIIILLFICGFNALSPEVILSTAQNILLNPGPAVGIPYQDIPGPSKDDRVCVVGAGPSGVHMAMRLKKLGYQDVVIFEKSNRVGGKSYDVKYRGVYYPMGTIFAEPSYFDNMVPLAREYGVGDLLKMPSYPVFTTNDASSNSSLGGYYLKEMEQFTNTDNSLINIGFALEKILKYIKLHNELFGGYEGDIMLKPTQENMNRVRGTFLEFLKREDLEPLKILFKTGLEMPGYGYVDDVSALYGLIWLKPKFMFLYVTRLLGQTPDEPFNLYTMKYGFEKIWQTIAEKEELDIRFNTEIFSVRRNFNKIILKLWVENTLQTEICGFLIWGAPMTELMKTVKDVSNEEWNLFKGLKPRYFTASLVNIKNAIKFNPFHVYLNSINSDAMPGGVGAAFNKKALATLDFSDEDDLETFNQQNLETCYVLQMSKDQMREKDLNEILVKHFVDGFNASTVEILQTISWPYFYRWSPEEMEEGRLWQVFNMQGKHRTWYIGSSVSFEATRSVVTYNDLILRHMVPHDQFYNSK